MSTINPAFGLVPIPQNWTAGDSVISSRELFSDFEEFNKLPYDFDGNIRVLRVYWKSRRKIKKVKSYDPQTGEEQFNFHPETYIIDPLKGEEEQIVKKIRTIYIQGDGNGHDQ